MIFTTKQEQKNITLLSLGRLISSLGSHVFSFALSLYVLDISGSAAVFSAVLSLAIIPKVLFNLFGGVWIDEKDKKKIMVATDLISAVLVLSFVPIFYFFPTHLGFIIAYTIILSSLHAINDLTITSAIPDIVNEESIPKTNSFLQIIFTLLSVVGPILGAVFYTSIGIQNILIFDGISFLIAGILSIFLQLKPKIFFEVENKLNYQQKMKQGYSYLMGQPLMRFLVLVAILLNGIYMPLMLLVIPFINYEIIEVSGTQLSLIEAAWAIGATLGGIYMATRKQTNRYIPRLFILLGFQAFLIFGWVCPAYLDFSTSKWLVTLFFSIILIVTGILNMIQNIPLISYVQAQIPEELRARVLGLINVFILASTPIGIFIYGILLQYISWTSVVIGSAALMLFISILSHKNRTFSVHTKKIQA